MKKVLKKRKKGRKALFFERMVKTGVQKASVPKSRSLLVTEELLRWCLQSKPYRWCQ